MGLKFKDIQGWKPTSISIVDKPSHPWAVFEVYEDDGEFIKKYKEELNLSEEDVIKNDEETVTMSSSFFERIFNGLVSKADPEPEDKKIEGAATDEVTIEDVIKTMDERFSIVEDTIADLKEELDNFKKEKEEPKEEEDPDLKGMVKKSKEVDPDLNQSEVPQESLMSRIGRSEDGMKW